MRLEDCTKSELIEIVRQMECSSLCSAASILQDISLRREEAKHKEAGEVLRRAHEKRMEYIDIMRPYEGKPWSDIPDCVISQAVEILSQAEKLDSRWNKLMGINRSRKGEK